MIRTKSACLIVTASIGTIVFCATALAQNVRAQASPYAEVKQRVHTTDVEITYHRPGVKGRTIWGEVVPYGKPWRAGANNNTTFECSTDVTIEGQKLAAGKYGFHIVPEKEEWTLAFNSVNNAWGSFTYDASKNVLTVKIKPEATENHEWLTYGFDNLTEDSATCYLAWEKLKGSFKIQVAK